MSPKGPTSQTFSKNRSVWGSQACVGPAKEFLESLVRIQGLGSRVEGAFFEQIIEKKRYAPKLLHTQRFISQNIDP